MYCRKCGKMLEEGQTTCPDCEEVEVHFGMEEPVVEPYEEPTSAPVAQEGNRMAGFKPALAATIMGFIGYILAYVGFLYSYIVFAGVSGESMTGMLELMFPMDENLMMDIPVQTLSGLAAFFALVGLGLGIPSIIMGAKSIKLFKQMKNEGKAKPVAALVLGIIGLVMGICAVIISACTLLIVLCSFMIASLQ